MPAAPQRRTQAHALQHPARAPRARRPQPWAHCPASGGALASRRAQAITESKTTAVTKSNGGDDFDSLKVVTEGVSALAESGKLKQAETREDSSQIEDKQQELVETDEVCESSPFRPTVTHL